MKKKFLLSLTVIEDASYQRKGHFAHSVPTYHPILRQFPSATAQRWSVLLFRLAARVWQHPGLVDRMAAKSWTGSSHWCHSCCHQLELSTSWLWRKTNKVKMIFSSWNWSPWWQLELATMVDNKLEEQNLSREGFVIIWLRNIYMKLLQKLPAPSAV